MLNKRWVLIQWSPALLIVFGAVLIIFSNNWGPLESSEARYAEIARAMFTKGDWLHPRLLNIQHFHKPPLTYWITVLGYYLFGTSMLDARFFLTISLLVQVILVYRITCLVLKDKQIALAAAIIYGSMPLVLISVKGLTTDAYLQTFTLLTIYSFIAWRNTKRIYWLYLTGLAAGLGFLTKGPLVLILPLLLYAGFYKDLTKHRISFHHVLALLLFIVVGLSWYAYLAFENPAFVRYFLLHQTYDRVANAEVFSRSEPFWYYALYTPLVALPWIILFIAAFIKGAWRQLPAALQQITRYGIVAPFILFSLISSKLILYILMIFPGISIVSAYFLFHYIRVPLQTILFFFLLIGISLYALPFIDSGISLSTDLWILPAVMILLLLLVQRYKHWHVTDRLLISAFLYSIFIIIYTARFNQLNEIMVNGTRPLAEWIQQNKFQEKNLLVYNRMLPSLAFNLNRDLIFIYDGNRYLKRETHFEKDDQWREYLFDLTQQDDVERLLPILSKNSVLIVKGDIKSHAAWMKKYFIHTHKMDKWVIYY